MQRARITDVAAHAGVSRASVSNVLRNAYGVSAEMREKVQRSIDALGYRPQLSARAMRGATFTVGIESPALLGTDFLPTIIDGAAEVLTRAGYDVITLPIHDVSDSADALDRLVDRQVDGIIALGTVLRSDDLERVAERTSLVAIGRHEQAGSFDTVTTDDRLGTQLALDHLYARGHRRIAHLTLGYPEMLAHTLDGHVIRRRTYEQHVQTLGLDAQVIYVNPEKLYSSAANVRTELVEVLRAEAERPTAIFAANDGLALELLAALDELGGSAQQVSVIGFDGASIGAHPRINLTTIDQSGRALGGTAAELLLERMNGRTAPVHRVLPPTVRPGATTFPARA